LAHFSGFSGVDISPTISVEADRLQSLRASVQELLNSAQQSFQTQKESGQIWLKDIETALGQAQRNFQDLETSTQNSTQEFLSNQHKK
jgi:hypothetical protein